MKIMFSDKSEVFLSKSDYGITLMEIHGKFRLDLTKYDTKELIKQLKRLNRKRRLIWKRKKR